MNAVEARLVAEVAAAPLGGVQWSQAWYALECVREAID